MVDSKENYKFDLGVKGLNNGRSLGVSFLVPCWSILQNSSLEFRISSSSRSSASATETLLSLLSPEEKALPSVGSLQSESLLVEFRGTSTSRLQSKKCIIADEGEILKLIFSY